MNNQSMFLKVRIYPLFTHLNWTILHIHLPYARCYPLKDRLFLRDSIKKENAMNASF